MINAKTQEIKRDLFDLTAFLCESENMKLVVVKFKSIQAGRAHYKQNYISMPFWTIGEGCEYAWAYMIHEICHFVVYYKFSQAKTHGATFKLIETKWLKEFGFVPIYKRAYTKELKSISGQTLWKRR